MTPSCCIRLMVSDSVQCSAILPSAIRWMLIKLHFTCFPVGGRPISGPTCVPSGSIRLTTFVAFGECVQESSLQIGEGRELPSKESAAALNARRRARRQSVIHEVRCEQGKGPIQVLCVDQVAEPANQGLVLFG